MKTWWKEQVVYQIYPRSFKDSNADGIGDLPGIISELDMLQDLGIGILWLSPIYTSPDYDNGYDISDYRNIDPKYGTMKDFDTLIKEAKKRNIRIVMDLVINHTSNQHIWFEESRNEDSPYRDYYIWKKKNELNNWTGFFAEDVWEYDAKSDSYYMHLFAKEQPDLNYHNPKVIEEIKDIMHFWLKKGVAGFRCDVINIIYKNSLEDGKKQLALTGIEHYLSKDGAINILQELREDVLSHYDCFTVGETVFVTPNDAKRLTHNALDMVFSFEHMEADQIYIKWLSKSFSLKKFAASITKWQTQVDWNANYLENHDQGRSVSRFADDQKYQKESAKMLGTLLFTLKGTPFLYQGEEIGVRNADFNSMIDIKDVESHNVYQLMRKMHIPHKVAWKLIQRKSRDHGRTVLPWTSDGGFTEGMPWLNYAQDPKELNYEIQIRNQDSVWSYYKELIHLRNTSPTLIYGDYQEIMVTKELYIYKRIYKNTDYLIILNFSDKYVKMNELVYLKGYNVVLSNYKLEVRNYISPYGALVLKKEGKNETI